MKNKLAGLLQRRTGISEKVAEVLASAKRAHRDLTDEERLQVRELEAKIRNVDFDMLDEFDESLKAGADAGTGPTKVDDDALDILEAAGHNVDALRDRIERQRKNPEAKAVARRRVDDDPSVTGQPRQSGSRQVRAYTAAEARRFEAMFGAPQASQFESLGEFLELMHHGVSDPRFEAASMVEGIGADGGYLVPPEYAAQLLDYALESEIVRPRARIEPMGSNTRTVAGFNTANHQSSIGGFTAQWVGEGGTMTKQKAAVRSITLKARKLCILAEVSDELIADAVGGNFDSVISPLLVQAISWHLDDAYLTGDGAQGPLGVINNPSAISVAKESGQVAATINYANVVKMFSRLHPACVKNAVWVANPSTLPHLLSLKQVITNVAATENVGGSWVPVLREDGSGNMTLLTRPVLLTEKLPALGTVGDLILCDFSQYIAGIRGGMSIKKSDHLLFDQDKTCYRIILRADGQSQWAEAQTPKAGSTLSWCVTLATRA